MSERFLHIRREVRPLRLAFLVPLGDKPYLSRVIAVNTCLWGGRFNALVPWAHRLPRWWGATRAPYNTMHEVAQGYIDTFEPDYLILTKEGMDLGFKPTVPTIPIDALCPREDSPQFKYGIDVEHVYRALFKKEFKFERRFPIKAVVPSTRDTRMQLLVGAAAGCFPEETGLSRLREDYTEAFGAIATEVEPGNYFEMFQPGGLTPLRAGSTQLQAYGGGDVFGPTLFFCDAQRPIDIIDYWNLRALGSEVLPIPSQWAAQLADRVRQFILDRHVERPRSGGMMTRTILLRSRSSSQGEVEAYAREVSPSAAGALEIQAWYPRIWDEDTRKVQRIRRPRLQALDIGGGAFIEVRLEGAFVSIPSISPRFMVGTALTGYPRWAMILQVRNYGGGEEAVVFPKELQKLSAIFGGLVGDEIAVSSEGLVVRAKGTGDLTLIGWPTGEDLFTAWYQERGLSAVLSQPGRTARELIRSLGGLLALGLIASAELLKELNRMAQGLATFEPSQDEPSAARARPHGRVVSRPRLLEILKRERDGNLESAEHWLARLTEREVLALALKVPCAACQQTNWFALSALGEQLRCERCLREFAFPVSDPPRNAWGYRTRGVFSVENYAQGSYASALALHFFSARFRGDVSWVPSMEIHENSKALGDVDFALWWQRELMPYAEPVLILGEAKSFGGTNDLFTAREVSRSKQLAARAPGSVFAFATLKDSLTRAESTRLAKLARHGRRPLRSGQSRMPVLILTGRELLSPLPPPMCWAGVSPRHNQVAQQFGHIQDVYQLCDATQQLYLGLEPYGDWLLARFKKQQERRRA